MLAYVARRLLFAVATVLVAILISLLLVRATDGSPGAIVLGITATPEQIAAKNAELGWDLPIWTQFYNYVSGLVQGDLGTSIIDSHSIGDDLVTRLPVTASIAIFSTLLSGIVGILLGVTAAVRGGRLSRIINSGAGVALSLPAFWVGILFVYVLAIQGELLPATGYVAFTDGPGRLGRKPGDPGADADRGRCRDRRPDRLRRNAGRPRAGAHPHPAGRWHADLADPLRACAAVRQRAGGLGAGHPVHRPVRWFGDHREPLRHAGSWPGQPNSHLLPRLPRAHRRGGRRHDRRRRSPTCCWTSWWRPSTRRCGQHERACERIDVTGRQPARNERSGGMSVLPLDAADQVAADPKPPTKSKSKVPYFLRSPAASSARPGCCC